jgi:mxaJ protein
MVAPCAVLLAAVAVSSCHGPAATPRRELRVCADPNNLPFSNERGDGFENRLAHLIAEELNAAVTYTWWPQRRGFVRHTLNAGLCDVVMGVPSDYELVRTTRPYYRSTYVFVSLRSRAYDIRSLDDPRLRSLRIGVHVIGDDYANAPPAHALAARNIVSNVVGYSIFGDYTEPNPPARLVEAVASGAIDVAIAWGPLAGYFAERQSVPLEIAPVSPPSEAQSLPMAYDIAMGVRPADESLKRELDDILRRKSREIAALLEQYAVPLVSR